MPITNEHWKSAVSGSFNTAARWNPAAVPGAGSSVFLDAAGSAYTVTSSATNTIDALSMKANATLDVAADVFTIHAQHSAAVNAGKIDIGAGATFALGVSSSPSTDDSGLSNTGAVTVSSTGAEAILRFAAPVNRLYGAGHINLSGHAEIIGGTTAATLINYDNTISGSGTIGSANLTLQNDKLGTIDANAAAALILKTGANTILNAGTIETTGAGGLTIDSAMNQSGKLIADGSGALRIVNTTVGGGGSVTAAVSGSSIVLDNGTLSMGGKVSTAAGSSIVTQAGTTDTISASDIQNAGSVVVTANSTLLANWTIYNTGSIKLNGATGAAATLEISSTGASFNGTGNLVLTNNANNFIVGDGSAVQLTNRSHISGAGTIGDANLRFVNLVGGVVNANGSIGLTIVGATNANENSDYNNGLIETTGAGGLTISNAFDNAGVLNAAGAGALTLSNVTIDSGGGTVEATKSGASIILANSTIGDGSVSIASGASLVASAGSADGLEVSVFNSGRIVVSNKSTLVAGGHWDNSGLISVAGSTGPTALRITGNFRLDGGGTLTMTSGAEDSILSDGAAAQLRNEDNMIEGAGTIGDANLTLQNEADGTINANGASALTINTGSNTVYNAGTIESNAASGITIDSGVDNEGFLIANTGTIDVAADVFGAGLAEINSTAEIEFGAGGTDAIFGANAHGILRLDHSSTTADAFDGAISGFTANDKLDLSDISPTGSSFTYQDNSAGGILTVTDGSHSTSLHMIGDYSQSFFHLGGDGHGGTFVT